MDDITASSLSSMDTHMLNSSSSSIFHNFPLLSALIAFIFAQTIKFFLTWCIERRWDAKRLVGSGGMPSSHSATVTALAFAVGFQDGFGGSPFAIAAIFACVVMYDSSGVRLHAGRQAEKQIIQMPCVVCVAVGFTFLLLKLPIQPVLNQIVFELPAEHPLAEARPLRELLGHTPPQVLAGATLGLVTAAIAHLIKKVISQA